MSTEHPPEIVALFAALGGPDAPAAIDTLATGGAPALRALLDALLDPPPSAVGADPRGWSEDLDACLARLARAHPGTLLDAFAARPALLDRLAIVAALRAVDDDRAGLHLLEALEHRSGVHRWLALRALLERGDARVAPRLRALLDDHDSSVSFAAIDGLRRWGTALDVGALAAHAVTAPLGAREAAWDAIESICARASAPLPREHPGARLDVLETEHHDAEVLVTVATWVPAGRPLAVKNGDPVLTAPRESVVVATDREPRRLRITLRRRT